MYVAITWSSTSDSGMSSLGSGFFSGRIWRFDDRVAELATQTNLSRYAKQMFLPYGVDALCYRPSVCQYTDRLYIVGGHTANLVVDEYERVWKQGIAPLPNPPAVTGATGTGSFAYWNLWDELTDEHSPLSEGQEIGTTTPRTWPNIPTAEPDNFMYPAGYINVQSANAIFASNVAGVASPTARLAYMRPGDKLYNGANVVAKLRYPGAVDSFTGVAYTTGIVTRPSGKPQQRATHVCLWLSYEGSLPRLVTKVRLGTTSVVESTGPTALGEAYPGDFERMPRGTMNTIYHERQLIAGDPNAKDTVYLSAIGFPERYEGLKFRTRGGDAITALIGTRDYCLVLTHRMTYIIQGYTEDDLKMDIADPEIGSAGHTCNTQIDGIPIITSRKGFYLYTGSWHPIIQESSGFFSEFYARKVNSTSRDSVRNTSTYFQTGQLVHNPLDNTIQMFMGYGADASNGSVPYWFRPKDTIVSQGLYSWVMNYETVVPQAGGSWGQAVLSFDALKTEVYSDRQPSATAFLTAEDGGGALWFGDNSGYLYREDSSETFAGASAILTPHWYFGDSGGFEREGKTLIKFWSHVESENSRWKVTVIGGGDWAGVGMACYPSWYGVPIPTPEIGDVRLWPIWLARELPPMNLVTPYEDTVEASYQTDYDTATTHCHPLPDRVSGRGFSWLYVFENPKNCVWKGVGGYFGPGPATRLLLVEPPSS